MSKFNRGDFFRFSQLDKVNIRRDFQIHTTYTDGAHTPLEIIEAAEKAGLSAIAFTEHVRRESVYYPDFFKDVDVLRQKRNLQVFIGVETKVINGAGDLDIKPEHYDLAELVLGSVHRIPTEGGLIHPRDLGRIKTMEHEFALSCAMVASGKIDVLAHPMGMSVRIHQSFSEIDLEELIRRVAGTDTAFELNAKYTNPDYFKAVIRLCRKYDPHVSVGSDVHKIEELGNSMRMLEGIL